METRSSQPVKGGMCVTNNAELDRKMRVLRDHGMSKEKRYWHEVVGFNYRMTNLQAAIGVAQLEHIGQIHAFRKEIEKDYRERLNDLEALEFQADDLPGCLEMVSPQKPVQNGILYEEFINIKSARAGI